MNTSPAKYNAFMDYPVLGIHTKCIISKKYISFIIHIETQLRDDLSDAKIFSLNIYAIGRSPSPSPSPESRAQVLSIHKFSHPLIIDN